MLHYDYKSFDYNVNSKILWHKGNYHAQVIQTYFVTNFHISVKYLRTIQEA